MDDSRKPGPGAPRTPHRTDPTIEPGISGTLRLDAKDVQEYFKAQRLRGSLLVIDGTSADIGNHLVVEDVVIIGRELRGIQLHDGGISRNHAEVERRENEYLIRDLGSTNGTMVNGVRLQGERVLNEGDKILLSQTVIKFTLVDETDTAYLMKVQNLVGTDSLTGLMSKHRFDAAFKEAFRAARSMNLNLSAMMMDMDGLKAVNDRHGHKYGAEIIRQVGKKIGEIIRGKGEACRFGGDEFSAFLPGAVLDAAMLLAGRIRGEVEALRAFPEQPDVGVTISIGVCDLSSEELDYAALLHKADGALYRAKAQGKNCVSE